MARDIPRDRPLSKENRAYLMDRGHYGLIAQLDQAHGTEAPDDSEFITQPGPESAPLRTAEITDPAQGPGVDLARENPGDPDEEAVPYEDWSPDELKAEAKRRGLKVSGPKQELVERLYKDDEDGE